MKRIVLWLIAGLFLGLFVLSSNRDWMKKLTAYRYSRASKLPSDRYRFGDLYGLSYLPDFKKRSFEAEDLRPHYVRNKPVSGVHLYSLCDSYMATYLLNDSLFKHADAYRFSRWDYTAKQFYLDPSKKNILLVEMVERRVRYTAPHPETIYKHLGVVADPSDETVEDVTPSSWWSTHLFNRNIEQNLEFNLFEYSWFTPIKEWKAQLNYKLFNRTSPEIVVSRKRQQLYFFPTIDATDNNSSFNYLSAGEVDTLVNSLNGIYHHYRQAGFTEVYLMVPPNPVTVLEPELAPYNRLIPRLQRHQALQMPVIDVYAKLHSLRKRPVYQISDGHWSKEGFLAATAQLDSMLATHSSLNAPQRLITGKFSPAMTSEK